MPDGTTAPRFGDPRLPRRFWDKARVEPSGCWRWTAAKSAGYGKFAWNGESVHAHLVAYRTLIGDIPDGLVADHECHRPDNCRGGGTCMHRSCVNPAHIGLKSNAKNTSRGRVSHWNMRKTHCPRGHEYTDENTRVSDGKRYCRSCERERADRRYRSVNPNAPRRGGTDCAKGHPYDAPVGGRRRCKVCDRSRKRSNGATHSAP